MMKSVSSDEIECRARHPEPPRERFTRGVVTTSDLRAIVEAVAELYRGRGRPMPAGFAEIWQRIQP